MRCSLCRHGAIGEGDPGFQYGQVAFALDFLAADEDGLADLDWLSEAALHLSGVGGDAFFEEEVVSHDLIHEGHDEAAVHAVVVALVLPLRREDGEAAIRGFEEMQVQPDGISFPAGKAHGVCRIPLPLGKRDPQPRALGGEDLDFFFCEFVCMVHGVYLQWFHYKGFEGGGEGGSM